MTEDTKENQTVPLKEAAQAIESASRRIALLHLSYAKTIMAELGSEKGEKLISKAIKDYGTKIGRKTREEVENKGLPPTPENFSKADTYTIPKIPGMHTKRERTEKEGKPLFRAHGCVLGKVWQEYDEEELGRLYCYMDTAKYMAYNLDYKYVHLKALPDGDECCEFTIKNTIRREKDDFQSQDADWFYIDK